MLGLTDYITECHWETTFTIWYTWIDDMYQSFIRLNGPLRRRGSGPVFSDSEVITVGLIIEAYFNGKEELGLSFVRQYHADLFPQLLDNSQFNRRRRQLTGVMEWMRQRLSHLLIPAEDRVRVMDSAPIPVCTYTRSRACMTVSGPEYASVMASKKAKLYGFRFYATTSMDQVIDHWMLAPAAPREGKIMSALLQDARDLFIVADNAFQTPDEIAWLQETRNIQVAAMRRSNDQNRLPAVVRRLFNRLRRRIETVFSVMSTAFTLERPGARSLSGLLCRITTTVLVYNLSFLTNFEYFSVK